MRERRVRDGNRVIFDAAKEVLNSRGRKDQVLMEMRGGPISYTTEEGVRFWARHPFQWVSKAEAELLKKHSNPEFRISSKADAEDYYAYE